MTNQEFLAGDVGGTKTRLAIFSKNDTGNLARGETEEFRSAEFPNLQTIISKFLKGEHPEVSTGCIGVPGPVFEGRVKVTNLPWELSESEIESSTDLRRMRLVNDLAATTAAIPYLKDSDLAVIVPGVRAAGQTQAAVIAPGTGLGMGFLVHGQSNIILPSEGGHARFAPSDLREIELLAFLMKRDGYVSNESLLCGPGIKNIYDFVASRFPEKITSELREAVDSAADPASVISRRALNKSDTACVETLEIFVGILASLCGDTAATGMTMGGIFLGGGIPPKIAPLLTTPLFTERFQQRGKMSGLMKQIPVFLIKDDYAALTGAASLASQGFDHLTSAATSAA